MKFTFSFIGDVIVWCSQFWILLFNFVLFQNDKKYNHVGLLSKLEPNEELKEYFDTQSMVATTYYP